MSEYIENLGKGAKAAKFAVSQLKTETKNQVLIACADALISNSDAIILANEEDMARAKANGMKESLLDRLSLDEKRIQGIANGLRKVAALSDPVGEVASMVNRPNGLMIGKKRVPLGVVAVIYESRPNVTADAFGLCFKSGNVCVLRSGSDAINSCVAIADTIKNTLEEYGIPREALTFVEQTDREYVNELMKLNKYIDVIIPRGGAGLIQNVVQNATVPVIETGVGNCHIYVDKKADIEMAVEIIENAKNSANGCL